eukprot:4086516-Pyramimonas_sp.AAC.1
MLAWNGLGRFWLISSFANCGETVGFLCWLRPFALAIALRLGLHMNGVLVLHVVEQLRQLRYFSS